MFFHPVHTWGTPTPSASTKPLTCDGHSLLLKDVVMNHHEINVGILIQVEERCNNLP